MDKSRISPNEEKVLKSLDSKDLKFLTDLYKENASKFKSLFLKSNISISEHTKFRDVKSFIMAINELYEKWELAKKSNDFQPSNAYRNFEKEMGEFKRAIKEIEEKKKKSMEKKKKTIDAFIKFFEDLDLNKDNSISSILTGVSIESGELQSWFLKDYSDNLVRDLNKIYPDKTQGSTVWQWVNEQLIPFTGILDDLASSTMLSINSRSKEFKKVSVNSGNIIEEKAEDLRESIEKSVKMRFNCLAQLFDISGYKGRQSAINDDKVQKKFREAESGLERLDGEEELEKIIDFVKSEWLKSYREIEKIKIEYFLTIFGELDEESAQKDMAVGLIIDGKNNLLKYDTKRFEREVREFIKKYNQSDDLMNEWHKNLKEFTNLMNNVTDNIYNEIVVLKEKFENFNTLKKLNVEKEIDQLKKDIKRVYGARVGLINEIFNISDYESSDSVLGDERVQEKFDTLCSCFESLSAKGEWKDLLEFVGADSLLKKINSGKILIGILKNFKENLMNNAITGIANFEGSLQKILNGEEATPFHLPADLKLSLGNKSIEKEVFDWIDKKFIKSVKILDGLSDDVSKNINNIDRAVFFSENKNPEEYKLYAVKVLTELNDGLRKRKEILDNVFDTSAFKTKVLDIVEVKKEFSEFNVSLNDSYLANQGVVSKEIKKLTTKR